MSAPATRPSDMFLLVTLAKALGITPEKAHEWLYTLDFDAVNDKLLENKREEVEA